jgi:hypothetical protein
MMSVRGLALLCTLSMGVNCTPAPAAPTSPVAPASGSGSSAVAAAIPALTAIAPPASPALPSAAEAPLPVTCRLASADFRPPAPLPLRTPAGHLFAKVTHVTDASMTLAAMPKFELDAFGVHLITVPKFGDIPVYVASPRQLDPLITAGGSTQLSWSVQDSKIHVRAPEDPRVHRIAVSASAADVLCSDIYLEPQLTAAAACSNATSMRLTASSTLDIAANENAPIEAQLRLPLHTPIDICERSKSQTKIGWRVEDGNLAGAYLSGWVTSAALKATPFRRPDASYSLGAGGFSVSSHWTGSTMRHPLWIRTEGALELVGEVLRGTKLERVRDVDSKILVKLIGPESNESPRPIQLRPGADFVVTQAAAKDCQ